MSKLFLAQNDVRELRDFTQHLDQNRFDVWVREVQVNEMRSFLGGVLYKKMYDDFDDNTKQFTNQAFIDLWLGVDTGQELFYGLKPSIALYVYAKLAKNNPFNLTRFDNSRLSDDITEASPITAATSKASEAASQALKYLNECEAWLIDNKTNYPDWLEPVNVNRQNATFKYYKVWPKR